MRMRSAGASWAMSAGPNTNINGRNILDLVSPKLIERFSVAVTLYLPRSAFARVRPAICDATSEFVLVPNRLNDHPNCGRHLVGRLQIHIVSALHNDLLTVGRKLY